MVFVKKAPPHITPTPPPWRFRICSHFLLTFLSLFIFCWYAASLFCHELCVCCDVQQSSEREWSSTREAHHRKFRKLKLISTRDTCHWEGSSSSDGKSNHNDFIECLQYNLLQHTFTFFRFYHSSHHHINVLWIFLRHCLAKPIFSFSSLHTLSEYILIYSFYFISPFHHPQRDYFPPTLLTRSFSHLFLADGRKRRKKNVKITFSCLPHFFGCFVDDFIARVRSSSIHKKFVGIRFRSLPTSILGYCCCHFSRDISESGENK